MIEFEKRCETAIEELRKLKESYQEDMALFEYNRIGGKVEGVQLALSYYREEKVLLEHAFDKKEALIYDGFRKEIIKNQKVIKS
jgi:hypothetical protein